jgi:hypothetical protein
MEDEIFKGLRPSQNGVVKLAVGTGESCDPRSITPHAGCAITSGTIFVGSDTMGTELRMIMDPAVDG